MSKPLGLNIDISIQLEAREGGVVLSALNNGVEIARGCGATIYEAIPALISFFKDTQEASIEALYAVGLIKRPATSFMDAPGQEKMS